jgi:hypothetical protein
LKTVFHFFHHFVSTEFRSSCAVLNKNPRDPISWAASREIPLPNGEMLHYNPDVRPGMEEWHEPVSQPFSGKEKFEWPTYNDRIHAPDGTFRLDTRHIMLSDLGTQKFLHKKPVTDFRYPRACGF